jgi:hypothetical protein
MARKGNTARAKGGASETVSAARRNGSDIITPATTCKSWRDWLPIHPAADLLPLMSKDELLVLGEDIKKNGLCERVAVIDGDDGKPILIDGRNRLDAMELVGQPFTLESVSMRLRCQEHLPGFDLYAYVTSINLHRRHLTAEQKRDLIAKLIKATPEKSDRQIAETVKASPTTVGKVREEMEPTVQSGQLKRVGKDGKARKQPRKRRTEDDFRRDLAAKKAAATAMPCEIGPMLPAAASPADAVVANPIITAWDNASDAQRQEFVKRRGVEIGQADPFAVPTFLRRTP